jgi:hypothetical protein
MPALLFALAILARSGPLSAALFCTPALELADDHRLPNASPPDVAADFAVGLPNIAAGVEDVNEDWFVGDVVGFIPENVEVDCEPELIEVFTEA